jgi:hypothetical protein
LPVAVLLAAWVAVYLTDGENNQLAVWTQGEGVSLSD